MRTFFLPFIILLLFSFSLRAQDDLNEIIEAESKAAMPFFSNQEKSLNSEETDNYDLKYHRLYWFIDPNEEYIAGSIISHFVALEDLTEIYFDLADEFTIDSIIYHTNSLTYVLADDLLQITLDNTITSGTLDSIAVYYKGIPNGGGFGSFTQSTHGSNDDPIIWTLSEPYGAQDWWPCKQDLTDKIDSIDVYVETGSDYRAASNGVLASETTIGDTTTIYYWKHRYPIPAYLIAIAVTNYTHYSNWVIMPNGDSLEVLNYVFPESLAYAESQTPDIVEMMEYFNEQFEPYPYAEEKYGHAQFGWGGGMEHTTMSFMGSFNYSLMAHELAHQWFGDKVTCGSWADIWLNEGFATYLTALNYEYQGLESSWENWKSQAISNVTSLPGGSVWVDDTTSVNRIFSGRLSYNKGALLLHMLRWEMGDEDFFEALQNYLEDPDLAYSYALTADLQEHLESVSGLDLDEFFSDWYTNQGYPSHIINYSQIGTAVTVSVHQNQSHPSVDFFELTLPLLFVGTTQDSLLSFSLTENDQSFSFDLDFEIENVIYDPQKWILSANNMISLGISDYDLGTGMSIYPNPTKDELTIFFSQAPSEDQDYSIIDDTGKLVKQGRLGKAQKISLPIQELEAGNYILLIQYSEGERSSKFIVIE
jgi:aminopeptidase N